MKKIKLKKASQAAPSTNRKIRYDELLNEQQYKAAMHNNGPALVIAGAGTGKTRTITYRLARLIEDGVPPDSILLLTFTRKSANEIKERTERILDHRAKEVLAGTFHSFAAMMLRRFAKHLSYNSNFSIMDQSDAQDTLGFVRQEYMSQKGIDPKSKRYPKEKLIYSIHSAAINKAEPIDTIIKEEYPKLLELNSFINEVSKRYDLYKKKSNSMDYDDLLINLKTLLTTDNPGRDHILNRFKYVMVDEYQDTNRLQHEISLILAGRSKNLMVVGDDAQSIYSFRGAHFENILFFPQQFDSCSIFKIEENYRSTEEVLALSNKVLEPAPFGYKKELQGQYKGEKPRIISCGNEKQQSLFLVQDILEKREDGEKLEDMAVLIRNGFHSFDLELELGKAGITFQKFGGLRFNETAHVKDVLSILKVVSNTSDVISWRRFLMRHPGIGNKTASSTIELLQENNSSLKEALSGANAKLKPISELISTIEAYKSNPEKAIEAAIEYYMPLLEHNYKDHTKREKDLEQFISLASGYKTLDSMLSDMAVDPVVSSVKELAGDDKEEEILTLSTIHSAKGLEWKHVYLIWALEGKFPSGRTGESVDSIEEERRLFYVAVTRAKTDLTITYPVNIFDRMSGMVLSSPSRFLQEVDENIAEHYVIQTDDDEDDSDDFWGGEDFFLPN
ncbi:MAG: ATP-dependent helicase [Candidatus Kapaibacteriales bacterium]